MSKLYMSATIGMAYIIKEIDDLNFLEEFFDGTGDFYSKSNIGVLFESPEDTEINGKICSLCIQVIKTMQKTPEMIAKFIEDIKLSTDPNEDTDRIKEILLKETVTYANILVNSDTLTEL